MPTHFGDRSEKLPTSITYVSISDVRTVSINLQRGVSETIYNLSFGELKLPPAKTPWRLAIRQQAIKLVKKLSDRLKTPIDVSIPWADVPTTDRASAGLSSLLITIDEVVSEMAKDKDVKTAMGKKIKSIKVVRADDDKVVLNNTILTIQVKLSHLEFFMSKKRIMENINKGL